MASERSRIKKAVVPASAEPAEPPLLQSALSAAHQLQHELAKEDNRSKEALRKMELNAKANEQKVELGKIGELLGGKDMAPLAIASIAVLGCIDIFTSATALGLVQWMDGKFTV